MRKSIFRAICIVSFCVFLSSIIFIMSVLYNYFSRTQLDALKSQTKLAASAVEDIGVKFLNDFKGNDYRITLISESGTVIFDTQSPTDSMENHLDREEVKQALEEGYGESSRYSKTLLEKTNYCAIKLSDGSIIRISKAQYSVFSLFLLMTQPFIIVAVIALALALFLAHRLSKRITKPLNELDLDKPEENEVYEEIKPLLERIELQKRMIDSKSAELSHRQEEFTASTKNMNEGLVVLNEECVIISINKAASKILSLDDHCIGKNLLSLNNSASLQELLNKSKTGDHSEVSLQLDATEYQVNASPIVTEGRIDGIVLLIFDITEKEKAEKIRREFTANVSHELKTPLQSISGYTELLKNGMVKPEDTDEFYDRILSESKRMIALIDDIISLSRLDSDIPDMEFCDTDLYEIVRAKTEILKGAAESVKVTLVLSGKSTFVYGIPHLLGDIVYNLCDNAIKYNRENGTVNVDIKSEEHFVILTVSDTGIGIPEEHKERIFERFYRVDKSHSKEVGGTGLGLSIVKHAAKIHNAEINLTSTINKGTSISVRFPKKS